MMRLKNLSIKSSDRIANCVLVLASIIFGIVAALTPVFERGATLQLNIWHGIVGTLIFALSCLVLAKLGDLWAEKGEVLHRPISKRKIFITVFCAILAIGFFYLFVYYPGTGTLDTIGIIKGHGNNSMNQHPWFFCLLVRTVRDIVFKFGGGYEAAFVVLSVIQIVITGLVYAGCAVIFCETTPFAICIAVALWLVLHPILDAYLIFQVKDVQFSLTLILWMLLLYDFWKSKGESLKESGTLVSIAALFILSSMRNNGFYVSAFIIFAMSLTFPKHWKRCLFSIFALFCVIFGSHIYESNHRITHLFKETVGIPLQQMAGVVYYGGKMTEEQKAFVNSVVPLDFIREKFDPYSSDKLKWGGRQLNNGFLNSHKAEFIKNWAAMLPANLKTYADTYLRSTYGFWSLDNLKTGVYSSIYNKAFKKWYQEEKISIKNIFPKRLQDSIESALYRIMDFTFLGAGTYFWIFLLLLISAGLRFGCKVCIIGMPIIGNWLTIMISTPTAYQGRYGFSTIIAIPLVLALLFHAKVSDISYEENSSKLGTFVSGIVVALYAAICISSFGYASGVEDGRTSQFKTFQYIFDARLDIKNEGTSGNDVKVLDISDSDANVSSPSWFCQNGIGRIITSSAGTLSFKLKCIGTGKLIIHLKGKAVRDAEKKRIPVWLNYTKFCVDGKAVFDGLEPVWHDKPHKFEMDVADGQIVDVQAEWVPEYAAIGKGVEKAVKTSAEKENEQIKSLMSELSKSNSEKSKMSAKLKKVSSSNKKLKRELDRIRSRFWYKVLHRLKLIG